MDPGGDDSDWIFVSTSLNTRLVNYKGISLTHDKLCVHKLKRNMEMISL